MQLLCIRWETPLTLQPEFVLAAVEKCLPENFSRKRLLILQYMHFCFLQKLFFPLVTVVGISPCAASILSFSLSEDEVAQTPRFLSLEDELLNKVLHFFSGPGFAGKFLLAWAVVCSSSGG